MTNEDLHELVAGYALDALDADDRHAFEGHLTECERCRVDLARLSEAAGTLAYAAEAAVPPEALRDRIVVAARSERPTVVALLRPRRTRLYAGAALAAAACAALAIGLWAALSDGSTTSKLALTLGPAGSARLAVSGLDPAPAGKIYEVWVIERGKPLPAGLFAGGRKTVVVRLTRPVPKGAIVAITLERRPGAAKPTPPVLLKTKAV
jgi:anti-sigma-K factor RskA